MENQAFEQFTRFTQVTLENMKKLGEANMKCSERLLKQQIELANNLFALTSKAAETVSKAKDVTEATSKQTEILQDAGKAVAETAKACADIMTDANKTYQVLIEEGFKVASENLNAAKNTKAKAA